MLKSPVEAMVNHQADYPVYLDVKNQKTKVH